MVTVLSQTYKLLRENHSGVHLLQMNYEDTQKGGEGLGGGGLLGVVFIKSSAQLVSRVQKSCYA